MGRSIADILSESAKTKLVTSNVNKGDIFRMKLTDEEGITPKNEGDTDRNKYFIVLGKTENGSLIGFVVINSIINIHIPKELQDLHYPIHESRYPFLGKQRFAYCGELKEITAENFAIRYEGNKRFGQLADDDMELIIGALRTSPLVTPKQMKKFGL